MTSTSTHRACPVPGTAVPRRARSTPADRHRRHPAGQLTASITSATTPTDGVPPLDVGDDHEVAVGGPAASTAALASSDSRAMVKTIPAAPPPM